MKIALVALALLLSIGFLIALPKRAKPTGVAPSGPSCDAVFAKINATDGWKIKLDPLEMKCIFDERNFVRKDAARKVDMKFIRREMADQCDAGNVQACSGHVVTLVGEGKTADAQKLADRLCALNVRGECDRAKALRIDFDKEIRDTRKALEGAKSH